MVCLLTGIILEKSGQSKESWLLEAGAVVCPVHPLALLPKRASAGNLAWPDIRRVAVLYLPLDL